MRWFVACNKNPSYGTVCTNPEAWFEWMDDLQIGQNGLPIIKPRQQGRPQKRQQLPPQFAPAPASQAFVRPMLAIQMPQPVMMQQQQHPPSFTASGQGPDLGELLGQIEDLKNDNTENFRKLMAAIAGLDNKIQFICVGLGQKQSVMPGSCPSDDHPY